MRKDRLQSLAESRKVNADSHQSPIIKNHKGSSTHHLPHHLTKDDDERAEEHNSRIENLNEKQSRSNQEAEESRRTEMPPRMKKPVTPKPSPKKIIRKQKDIKHQSLKGRLTRILSAKTEEHNWGIQKKLLREWGLIERNIWREPVAIINNSGISRYLGAPQIAKMGNLKDLAAKYIVSRFHDGKLWLDNPVEITEDLIHHVMGLPKKGDRVPMDMPSAKMIEEELGSEEEGTNSKGIRISQARHDYVKWVLTIIVVCLTNVGRPSSIKREVLPAAVQIAENGTIYNWSKYVFDLLIENIKNYQDTGANTRFPSLIIWLAMIDITPVDETQFTATGQPFMFNF